MVFSNKTFYFKERRNAGIASLRNRSFERKKENIDVDDDDDDDGENDKDESDKMNENVSNMREKRFLEFASIEYNGEIYMVN